MHSLKPHDLGPDWNCTCGEPWLSCVESRRELLRTHDDDLRQLPYSLMVNMRDAELTLGQVPAGLATRCARLLEQAALIQSHRASRRQHENVTWLARERNKGRRWPP